MHQHDPTRQARRWLARVAWFALAVFLATSSAGSGATRAGGAGIPGTDGGADCGRRLDVDRAGGGDSGSAATASATYRGECGEYEEAESVDYEEYEEGEYVGFLGDLVRPAASALFDELRRDLRAEATQLPERVRAQLRPLFSGVRAGQVGLSATAVEQTVFVVDPERTRPLFALVPEAVAAITVGDVIVFARGQYRPDCIEGIALIGHELVHVAQYRSLGRDRFLERYFLAETLERFLGGAISGEPIDLSKNRLEIDAYCYQEKICLALARTGSIAACDGREVPACRSCPSSKPRAATSPAVHGPHASPQSPPRP